MNTEQLTTGHPNALGSRRTWATHRLRPADARTRRAGRLALLVNRVLDLSVATTMLVVLALPMAMLALLIKLTSRGPAIYRQERIGLDGRTFVMFKFRTMSVDAEAQSGPVWAKRGDPRRTTMGVLLRRLSLDELPQLINVVRGEMSLVGPRPERPHFIRAFSQTLPAYNDRHQVLPGITGWAQINGWRGDSSIEKRLEHDLYYVEHWSVLFNVRIMLLTPFRMLVEQNAC